MNEGAPVGKRKNVERAFWADAGDANQEAKQRQFVVLKKSIKIEGVLTYSKVRKEECAVAYCEGALECGRRKDGIPHASNIEDKHALVFPFDNSLE
jgi:hypothetical protein